MEEIVQVLKTFDFYFTDVYYSQTFRKSWEINFIEAWANVITMKQNFFLKLLLN